MALSPQYSWPEPDNSSLVKNGAQDIRALGDAIDTSVWNVGYGQAGKNKIINGDFGIWQRGTSFTVDSYTADRFKMVLSGATATLSRQAFTVGQTDVDGNPTYFARLAATTGDNACRIQTLLEGVLLSSAKTFTLSFWAKGTNPAGGSFAISSQQEFGIGGSTAVVTQEGTFAVTASWQRFTKTFTYASVTGKTIGSSNGYGIDIRQPLGDTGTAAWTLDIANVQLEYGSTATPFQTASGGSPQAELAMCQRYYFRANSTGGYKTLGNGYAGSANALDVTIVLPSQMRVIPTALDTSAMSSFYYESATGGTTPTSITLAARSTENLGQIAFNKTGSFTAGYAYSVFSNNTAAYLGFSAEL